MIPVINENHYFTGSFLTSTFPVEMAGMNVYILRILFFLLPGILLPANLHAQELNLQQKITIEFSNIPFYKVLDSIAEQSNISFSYNPKKIPTFTLVSVNAIEKPVSEILDDLFKGMRIRYLVVEEQIVLKMLEPTKDEKKVREYFTLSGFIRDVNSGEILVGATVVLVDPVHGTISNGYGFYSITLPEGNYFIRFSFLGYSSIEKEIELFENKNLDVELEEDPSMLDEVVIRTDENFLEIQKTQMGKISINPRDVQDMPALMGEVDVLKSLQSVPGINFFSDGSTLFYVRGGNKDQNLILLDEAPVYNPAHLLGFFSVFIPDAVNKCKMADKVQFIQILDSTRTKERSQKYEQWGQVEEAIQRLAETKLKNVIEYKLFCGKKAGSDLESGFKQMLQKHVLSIL